MWDGSRGCCLAIAAAIAVLSACEATEPVPTEPPSPSSPLEVIAFTEPGTEATIPALDADGAWGTITVTRGADTGGYPTSAVDPGTFVVEAHVEYLVSGETGATVGARDWALVAASDRRPVGHAFVPDPPDQPWETWDRPSLPVETTTDMIAVEPRVIEGWLLFEVPRRLSDAPLELVYRPEEFVEAVSVLAIRAPGPAPEPVPTATPEPRPRTLSYVRGAGAPFTIIGDREADRLFADVDTCSNPVAGYSVRFPDDWYTNTAVGTTPACSWFSPTFFEVEGPEVPDEIAITIASFEAGIGFVHEPDYSVSDQLTVDGRTASRTEEVGGIGADGWLPRSLFTYQYTIWASDDPLGLKVVATTSNADAGSYEVNKAVLDRIMASLRFDR